MPQAWQHEKDNRRAAVSVYLPRFALDSANTKKMQSFAQRCTLLGEGFVWTHRESECPSHRAVARRKRKVVRVDPSVGDVRHPNLHPLHVGCVEPKDEANLAVRDAATLVLKRSGFADVLDGHARAQPPVRGSNLRRQLLSMLELDLRNGDVIALAPARVVAVEFNIYVPGVVRRRGPHHCTDAEGRHEGTVCAKDTPVLVDDPGPGGESLLQQLVPHLLPKRPRPHMARVLVSPSSSQKISGGSSTEGIVTWCSLVVAAMSWPCKRRAAFATNRAVSSPIRGSFSMRPSCNLTRTGDEALGVKHSALAKHRHRHRLAHGSGFRLA